MYVSANGLTARSPPNDHIIPCLTVFSVQSGDGDDDPSLIVTSADTACRASGTDTVNDGFDFLGALIQVVIQ